MIPTLPEDRVQPEWYVSIKIAQEAGVPAWVLEGQTAEPYILFYWKQRYMATMNIEAEAQKIINRHRENKAQRKSLI